jgi:hypothetical protein
VSGKYAVPGLQVDRTEPVVEHNVRSEIAGIARPGVQLPGKLGMLYTLQHLQFTDRRSAPDSGAFPNVSVAVRT